MEEQRSGKQASSKGKQRSERSLRLFAASFVLFSEKVNPRQGEWCGFPRSCTESVVEVNDDSDRLNDLSGRNAELSGTGVESLPVFFFLLMK